MARLKRISAPRRCYTMVSNAWARDSTLAWEDRGLLLWFMSQEDGRCVDLQTIMDAGPASRDKIRGMLRRLVAGGYLIMQRVRDAMGRLAKGTVWQLRDPHVLIDEPSPQAGKPVRGSDQAKRRVSAGQSTDGFSVRGDLLTTTEEQKNKKTPTREHARRTSEDTHMAPKTKQTKLPGLAAWEMQTRRPNFDVDQQIRAQAGQIVDEYIAVCRRRGGTPVRRVIDQVRAEITELVREGVQPDDIRRGCAEWIRTGLPASQIPHQVNLIVTGHQPESRAAREARRRDEEAAAVVQRLAEREHGDLDDALAVFGRPRLAVGQ